MPHCESVTTGQKHKLLDKFILAYGLSKPSDLVKPLLELCHTPVSSSLNYDNALRNFLCIMTSKTSIFVAASNLSHVFVVSIPIVA